MVQERTDSRASFDQDSPALASASRRRLTKWLIPLGMTACYLAFALAVQLRMLDSLDIAVYHAARPGDVWGPLQIRATHVVDDLRPPHVALALLLIVAGLSILRRSLRPVAVAALVGVPVAIVTLGTKWVMAPDPGAAHVGSFPSGHAVCVIIAVGLVVLLCRPRTRWGWMLPAVMGCLMGSALILASVHPATDVIGAGLLAVAALTGASAAGLGRWASARRGRSVG